MNSGGDGKNAGDKGGIKYLTTLGLGGGKIAVGPGAPITHSIYTPLWIDKISSIICRFRLTF